MTALLMVWAISTMPSATDLTGEQALLLRTILERHRSTAEALAHLKCEFLVEIENAPEMLRRTAGQYARLGRDFRIVQTIGSGEKQTICFVNGVMKMAATNPDGSSYGLIQIPEHRATLSEVWENHLLHLPGRNGSCAPLWEVIDRDLERWLDLRSTLESGQDLFLMQMQLKRGERKDGSRHLRVVLDPARGYLTTQMTLQVTNEDPVRLIERHVRAVSFVEVSPGLFIPDQTKMVAKRDGVIVQSIRYQIAKIEFRPNLSPTDFTVSFSPGSRLIDKIRNEVSTLGPDGKPTGAPRQLDARAVPLPASLPVTPPPPAPENWPWHWWLLATLPLAGLLWWFWRRRLAD